MSHRRSTSPPPPRCDLSVIIPSYKPGPYLFDCLRSLLAQRTDYVYEVIVVDSSPKDVTSELRQHFPGVKVLHLPHRAFPGAARNVGIAQAQGEILAFTDADCVVPPDWIERIVTSQRDGMRVVGGPIRNGTPDSLLGTAQLLLEFNSFQADRGGARTVEVLPTCNVAYHRTCFAQGGFDNAIKGSDSVFSRRLAQQGVKLFLVPGIRILHRNYTTWDAFLRNQFQLGTGSALTRRKLALRDSFVVQSPLFALSIPLARTVAIAYRLLRWSPMNFVRFLLLYPLIFLGLIVFSAGFVRGLRLK
ncbi:MAG: glycosyltransferase [Candidatus Oleimicrobiaceae bacterium]